MSKEYIKIFTYKNKNVYLGFTPYTWGIPFKVECQEHLPIRIGFLCFELCIWKSFKY